MVAAELVCEEGSTIVRQLGELMAREWGLSEAHTESIGFQGADGMAFDHVKFMKRVVIAMCLPCILCGCSETPTGTVQTSTVSEAPATPEDAVDSGDENGPAISAPLEEPPVK